MDKDSCYELGYIEKSHGLSGDVQIYLDVDNPEEYFEMESVFVEINKKLVPFFISKSSVHRAKQMIVTFEDLKDVSEADSLKGCKLWLSLSKLPKLESHQFYFHEIVGFDVRDKKLGPLGKVISVYEGTGQDLLAVDYKGDEVLIPITDQILLKVDKVEQNIEVNIPEGLLDVYITENEDED